MYNNLQDDGLRDSSKIAAFDFDGCLAKTDVKRYFFIWSHDLWLIMLLAFVDLWIGYILSKLFFQTDIIVVVDVVSWHT